MVSSLTFDLTNNDLEEAFTKRLDLRNMLIVLDPLTCQWYLLGKKSQLDLRPFDVGVLAMGRKVMT